MFLCYEDGIEAEVDGDDACRLRLRLEELSLVATDRLRRGMVKRAVMLRSRPAKAVAQLRNTGVI
jgi:hypothetical protein